MKIPFVNSRPPDHLAARLLRKHRRQVSRLKAQMAKLLKRIQYHTTQRNAGAVWELTAVLANVVEQLRVLEELMPTSSPGEFCLSVPSLILHDAFLLCTATTDEGMCFLAGIEVDGLAVGTRLIQAPYSHRSIAAAGADHRSLHRILIELHESGHRLLALLHAHPGNGSHANLPSGVDQQTQRAFEVTTEMIGGIFSRDGYLRWFSASRPFRIQVVGNHVEQINKTLYRLNLEEAPVAL